MGIEKKRNCLKLLISYGTFYFSYAHIITKKYTKFQSSSSSLSVSVEHLCVPGSCAVRRSAASAHRADTVRTTSTISQYHPIFYLDCFVRHLKQIFDHKCQYWGVSPSVPGSPANFSHCAVAHPDLLVSTASTTPAHPHAGMPNPVSFVFKTLLLREHPFLLFP